MEEGEGYIGGVGARLFVRGDFEMDRRNGRSRLELKLLMMDDDEIKEDFLYAGILMPR
jgi:hypothetical protein